MKRTTYLAAGALLLVLVPAVRGAEPAAKPAVRSAANSAAPQPAKQAPAAPAAAVSRLQALSDTELRGVVRPAVPSVVYLPPAPARSGWFRLLQPGAQQDGGRNSRLPFLPGFPLSADIVARDVDYGANSPFPRMNVDGSVTLPLPVSIGELDIQNIRAAPGDAASFGAVQVKGIDLGRTSIIVTPGK